MNKVTIKIPAKNREYKFTKGELLLEALNTTEYALRSPCGGQGTCGKCKIRILEGESPPTIQDQRLFSPEELKSGWRLACQTVLNDSISLEIPSEALALETKVLTHGIQHEEKLDPYIRKIFAHLTEPTLETAGSDAENLLKHLKLPPDQISLNAIRNLPVTLRKNNFKITALCCGKQITDIEEGDTTAQNFGIAIDIGTTTVAGFLHDLKNGKSISVLSRTNPQRSFGDDVISRILKASTPEGLHEVQKSILTCINGMVHEFCKEQNISKKHIYEIVIAGNTTMQHLFLGIDPQFLAQSPYTGVFRAGINVSAQELKLDINPNGNIHVLPNIAGFVGGDIVAGILSSGMHAGDSLKLLIDIGTNGEIVLGNKDGLVACSTAAGPAFEGGRIRHGMRAEAGAIEKVMMDATLHLTTIENAPVKGICGTGLIDLISELLRLGILDITGRILDADELPKNLPEEIQKLLIPQENGTGFLLFKGRNQQADIVLTPKDIREFQLAKAAIYSGIQILLKARGITLQQVDEILLAGAFGNFIRVNSARRVGLLPDMPIDKIRFIGNSAGAGARMALLSQSHRKEAEEISQKTKHVELATDPDFQNIFADALLFPETISG
jgi:uncharacterized 2Fe-2S/4Fe-4S cluster protein (DUF4445 family)